MRPYARQIDFSRPTGRLTAAFLLGIVAGNAFPAPLSVTVLLPNGKPLAGAVVMAQPTSGPPHPAAPVSAVMDQINRAFEPDLLVVPINSTVSFPNSDTVSHQIYSFSAPKRFQLPLYRGKPYPPVRFETPGIVTLGCNIHDEMLAYVIVTDAPFFGRSALAGTWSAEVPAGTYRINIWHPRIRDEDKDLQGEITVAAGTAGTLQLRLKKLLKPAPLEGRPHSWDGY
jgi:plastocyanin